jgi:hypothetical protein
MGHNLPFIMCPTINASTQEAKSMFDKIDRENKKTILPKVLKELNGNV